jgi:hypothetical protein
MELRIINLVIAVGLLIWSFRWYRRNHGAELYAGPVAIYALHVLLFHAFTIARGLGLFSEVDVMVIDTWSSGLRLHSEITLALLAVTIQRLRHRILI